MAEIRKRHVPKSKYVLDGEIQIGDHKDIAEGIWVDPDVRTVAAYSMAQAKLLLAKRFERLLGRRVFIGNAMVHKVGVLIPNTPSKTQRKERKIVSSGWVQEVFHF